MKNGAAYEEVSVEARDITTYLEFSGNIEASNISKVYPDTSAKVLEVLVEEGDEVKKGDVIALLDSGDTEYNISLKENTDEQKAVYENALAQAKAELTKAKDK